MPGKFVISLTCAKNDTDKATVAFVVANAAVASDKKTLVFLSIRSAVPFIVQLPRTRICASRAPEKSVETPLATTTSKNWLVPGALKASSLLPLPANSIVPAVETKLPVFLKLL